MPYIDHAFLSDEPSTWFKRLFSRDRFEVEYTEMAPPVKHDDVYTEQVLFEYTPSPWRLCIRWSRAVTELLNERSSIFSTEPILLEWTNRIANHWSCHWLDKGLATLAKGGVPFTIELPYQVESDATYIVTLHIVDQHTGHAGSICLYFYCPPQLNHTQEGAVAPMPKLHQPTIEHMMQVATMGMAFINGQGEVTFINQRLRHKEVGLRQKLLPLPWELVFHPELLKNAWALYALYRRSTYATPWLNGYDSYTGLKKGPYILVLGPLNDGAALQFQPIQSDQAEQLQYTHLDSLTGVYTRDVWIERLGFIEQSQGWLGILGLDNFKQVNDTLGHTLGDIYLNEVATRLKVHFPDATLGRWGGDEFVIWSTQAQPLDISVIFNAPYRLGSEQFIGSASLGLVQVGLDDFPHEKIQPLEWALQDAKNKGRGKVHIANKDANSHTDPRRQLFHIKNGLDQAVELKQFFLLYQPLVRLEDHKIIGAEALIRWRHPELGIISPAHFITIAEQTGAIIPMTDWVLHCALNDAKQWALHHNLTLSVNLSPSQFYEPTLVEDVKALLANLSYPAKNLKLEITEGVVLENTTQNKDTLDQLRSLGLSFAIDDFGTGNSSLAYLKDFPLQQLKIDKSYVDAISRSHNRLLTENIISLAHNMGLIVVAEGVETEDQERILLEIGCDLGQGYKYGKPMSAEDMTRLLRSQ